MHRAEKLLLPVAGSNFLFRIYGIDAFIYFLTRGIFHFCCGNLGWLFKTKYKDPNPSAGSFKWKILDKFPIGRECANWSFLQSAMELLQIVTA